MKVEELNININKEVCEIMLDYANNVVLRELLNISFVYGNIRDVLAEFSVHNGSRPHELDECYGGLYKYLENFWKGLSKKEKIALNFWAYEDKKDIIYDEAPYNYDIDDENYERGLSKVIEEEILYNTENPSFCTDSIVELLMDYVCAFAVDVGFYEYDEEYKEDLDLNIKNTIDFYCKNKK